MPHPTRHRLLEAGIELAATHGLAQMTVDAIVDKAGLGKGTFYVHFPDRTAFLVALHAQFHDRLLHAIREATAALPPGAERLLQGVTTYLNKCQQERAVKALLLEARSNAAIAAEVQRRNAEFAWQAQDDLPPWDGLTRRWLPASLWRWWLKQLYSNWPAVRATRRCAPPFGASPALYGKGIFSLH